MPRGKVTRVRALAASSIDVDSDEMLDIMEECYVLGAQEALYRANQDRDTIRTIAGLIRDLNWENDEWVENLIDHMYELVRGPKGKRQSSGTDSQPPLRS